MVSIERCVENYRCEVTEDGERVLLPNDKPYSKMKVGEGSK